MIRGPLEAEVEAVLSSAILCDGDDPNDACPVSVRHSCIAERYGSEPSMTDEAASDFGDLAEAVTRKCILPRVGEGAPKAGTGQVGEGTEANRAGLFTPNGITKLLPNDEAVSLGSASLGKVARSADEVLDAIVQAVADVSPERPLTRQAVRASRLEAARSVAALISGIQ